MDQINNSGDNRKVVTISRKKVVWFIVFAIIVGFGIYGIRFAFDDVYGVRYGGGIPTPGVDVDYSSYNNNVDTSPSFGRPANYGYEGYQQSDITDSREFMKTSYAATVQTRDVSKVVTSVNNIIKGSDGRVDNTYSSDKSGYVRFVVPKSKFESFREQIESLTSRKLISVTMSESNLLNTKQNIESQQNSVNATITSLNKESENLTVAYNSDIKSFNASIDNLNGQLTQVRASIANTTDQPTILELRSTEAGILNQLNDYRAKVKSRTNTYNIQKENYERLLSQQNSILNSVNKQDTQFTNNIETVNGTIDVRWVSLWKLFSIYSPISPFWIIVIILIVLIWRYFRRTKIVFV